MAGVEQMYLRLRHVRGIGGGAGHGERRIVLAPEHQGGRLPLPKISLPRRIGGDVVPIIIEQLGLDVRFAGTVQKCELVGPGIRIIEFGTRTPADMPGFMQLLTGIYLLVGLTWFNVFRDAAPLYMAGLAFTAYGIHWFAMAHQRYIDSNVQLDGWMAIAFLFLSMLGVDVFWRAGDIPVMILFVGLTLIYATEIPTRFLSWNLGGRVTGLFQFVTGVWLMYCTYAMTVDLALSAKAWI